MPFKIFGSGDVLTAVEMNDYVMEQVITTTTSGNKPVAPVEGQHIYETDTDSLVVWDGSAWRRVARVAAWETYTPTWSTGATQPSIGLGTLTGRYQQIGRTMVFSAGLTWGSNTFGGSGQWIIGLPLAAASLPAPLADLQIGVGKSFDASNGTHFLHFVSRTGVTGVNAYGWNTAAGQVSAVSASNPFVFAPGDTFTVSGTYEVG